MGDSFTSAIDATTLMQLASDGLLSQVSLASGHYTGLDLSGVRIEAVDARNTLFEDCVFVESNWEICRLEGARFERCNLSDSKFSHCIGPGLRAAHCDLSSNWWQDNVFPEADFSSSCLDNIAISHCDLNAARLPARLNKAWFSTCQMADLSFNEPAQWHQINVLESNLVCFDLSEATLTQCSFVRCVLDALRASGLKAPYLSFWQCSLREANLSRAALEGANFEEADLSNAQLSGSHLLRARLVRAKTHGATFIKADLSQADASYLQAGNADFTGSQWDLTNGHGAELAQARWTDCNRSSLRLTDAVLLRAEQWPAKQ